MLNVADTLFTEWSINPLWTAKDARHAAGKPGSIYFVADEQGFIKIGFSTRVAQRLSELRTSTRQALTLLGTEAGTRDRERELHRRFRHLHERGEWFRPGDDLADFIASLGEVAS